MSTDEKLLIDLSSYDDVSAILTEIRDKRLERNRRFLEQLIPHLSVDHHKANSIDSNINIDAFSSKSAIVRGDGETTCKENAAIAIQRVFRGYRGRKRYVTMLSEQYTAEEERFEVHKRQQTAEGEILVQSYMMERELIDSDLVAKNRLRYLNSCASAIQRSWRKHKHTPVKDHVCCDCFDDYPDLHDYYDNMRALCFCCQAHKNMQQKEKVEEIESTEIEKRYTEEAEDIEVNCAQKNAVTLENKEEDRLTYAKLCSMSTSQLHEVVAELKRKVCDKNEALMQELVLRDTLHLQHKTLLVDAHDAAENVEK